MIAMNETYLGGLRSLLLLGSLVGTTGSSAGGQGQLLLAEHHLADDGLELGLVHQGVEPSHHVGEGSAVRSLSHELKRVHQGGNQGNIGQGHLVAHNVGLVGEVSLKDGQRLGQIALGLVGQSSVERCNAQVRVVPKSGRKLNIVSSEVNPSVDGSRVEESLAEKFGVVSQASHIASDGVGLEQGALRSVKHGHSGQRRLLQESRSQVVSAHGELGDIDLNVVVLGSDQDLESSEVSGVGIQGVGHD